MTDRPIIFSSPMVRALLDGRKTQTRRIPWRRMRLDPPDFCGSRYDSLDDPECWGWMDDGGQWVTLKGGCLSRQAFLGYEVGDRLWVRETWAKNYAGIPEFPPHYRADFPGNYDAAMTEHHGFGLMKWKPSIHMFRKFSRLTLTVTDVRVQRLQDITPANAIAEGIRPAANSQTIDCDTPNPVDEFAHLWNSINGPDAWDANPWVVALTFTVEQRNIDA